MAQASSVRLIRKTVQHVSVDFFQQLKANDILFVDSSHQARIGSDVAYLLLEVLPALSHGVIVHIHDINFPFTTVPPEKFIFRTHHFYNESYMVQALLSGTRSFEILLCCSYLHYKHLREFPEFASSLWIRRIDRP
jgi:hypothetical protein